MNPIIIPALLVANLAGLNTSGEGRMQDDWLLGIS